jgi:hypothetical protein
MRHLFAGFGALLFVVTGTAAAVPPAYNGPMGNPEEPALRPYKWFYHGMKTLVHHPVTKFNQGNSVLPGIGTLEAWRGAREGVFDLTESVYHGAIFSIPPKSDAYKETGKINAFIDEDPMLETVADLPTVPLRAFDPHPAALRERMELVEKHAQKVREQRRIAREERSGLTKAQKAEKKAKESRPKRTPTKVLLSPPPVIHIEPY